MKHTKATLWTTLLKRWPSFIAWSLGVVALLLGLYARWPDLPHPFLWLDEAWRAWSVSSTAGLPSFLEYMKTNSEVLLFSEWVLGKLSLILFGGGAFAFRIWPLLFGILSATGAFILLRRLGHLSLAPAAALIIAVSWGFSYHSREFKPYALDLTLALWSMWAMVNAIRGKRFWLFLLLLSLMAVSSVTFVFMFPAIFFCYGITKKPRRLARMWPFLIPVALFIVTYLFFLRPQDPEGTTAFWAANYITNKQEAISLIKRYPEYLDAWSIIGWKPVTILFLVVLPVVSIIRKDSLALVFLLPFIFQIAAASLRLYPFLDRPSYYLYGLMHCGAIYAVGQLVNLLLRDIPSKVARVEAIVCLALFLFVGFSGHLRHNIAMGRQWPADQGHAAMEVLAQEFQPGDHIFINGYAYFTFLYHRDRVFPPNHPLRTMTMDRQRTPIADSDIQKLRSGIQARAKSINPGDIVWFYSAYQPSAFQYYEALFATTGEMTFKLRTPFQTLLKLKVNDSLENILNDDDIQASQ